MDESISPETPVQLAPIMYSVANIQLFRNHKAPSQSVTQIIGIGIFTLAKVHCP
jgi:hypothetical protein